MLHYIIQTIAFQLFFLIIYDVFLKKETFFNWNRVYLLATSLLSIILPFIKIESFKNAVPQDYIISLPAIILGESPVNNTVLLNPVVLGQTNDTPIWGIIFYLGVVIASGLFLYKLIKIIVLIVKNPKRYSGKLILVKLINSNAAFSFFRYVFLGECLENKEKETILKHEMIHVKHMHSLDLLCFEILRIVFWFNPLVYMYQNRVIALHEFIADAEVVKHQNKSHYYQSLLAQVFETKNISFINPFFKQSLIKKRIIMLQKTKSKQVKLFKYALLIPLVFGMLIYTSCGTVKNRTEKKELPLTDQITKLQKAVESREEGVTSEEKDAMKNLSEALDKTKYANLDDVPFSKVDNTPIYPGCENLAADEQRKCMSTNISNHLNANFNTKIGKAIGLIGKQRINVIFKIDRDGYIIDLRARAPHAVLETEAMRVIKTLPKMIAGEHNGKKVNVLYSLPIIFQVKE